MPTHYHVYCGPPAGRVYQLRCRATDVFRTREAAQKWATAQRTAGRRLARKCEGGPECPGDQIPEHGTRPPLAQETRPRRRRSPRLIALRRQLDELAPAQLKAIADFIEALPG